MTISVALVDDQALIRTGFRMVLHATDDIRVVGESGDGATALAMVKQSHPDVVLMDVRMPGVDGIEATRRIVDADLGVRVLILTTFDMDEYAFAGLKAGASGFLLKDVQPEELIAAVRAVAAGDAVVTPRITRHLLDHAAPMLDTGPGHQAPDALADLTDREREVVLAIARGLSNNEIAAELTLSEATVKTHITRILSKLGLRDRVQVVILAYEQHLV